MKVLQATRRLTTEVDGKEIVISKGDYVLSEGESSGEYNLVIWMHKFKKSTASLTDTGITLPEMYTRFTIEKFQSVMKVILLAHENKFQFYEAHFGNRIKDGAYQEEDILTSCENVFENTVDKRVVLSFSQCLKSIAPEGIFEREGKPVIAMSNRFQAIFVDLMGPIDAEYVKNFEKLMKDMKVLSEDDKRKIVYKKLADAWNKKLKDRKLALQDELVKFVKKSDQLQLDLVQNMANVRNSSRELEQIRSMLAQDGEEIAEKIKEVEDLPFVKSTSFQDTTFIVDVKDFETPFEVDGKHYEVPFKNVRFEITPERIRIFHDNPAKDGDYVWYHMHVQGPDPSYAQQFVCFGDHRAKVSNMIAERKFKQAVFTAMTLLRTYNPDDKLLSIENYIRLRKLKPVDKKQKTLVTAEEM